MSGNTNSNRQTARRQATRAEIVEASWESVRELGLAGLSMRDLGERVGMRAQSIYSYFGSKHEIYDAMFLEGYEALIAWMNDTDTDPTGDPIERARHSAHALVEFCTNDPVRYQLLLQRTIPGFTPSPESWAVALRWYEQTRQRLKAIGVSDQATMDLWSAMLTGLTDQQISNDPGGNRWAQLVDRAVDLLLIDIRTHTTNESEPR